MNTAQTPKQTISKDSLNLQALKSAVMDIAGRIGSGRPLVEFLIFGLKRGTVGLLAGVSGAGKSFLILSWAVALVCRGLNNVGLDFKNECGVLYVSLEDDEESVWDRLYSILSGAAQEQINQVSRGLRIMCLYGKSFDMNTHTTDIAAFLAENKDIGLVIFDTFSRSHSMNENSSGEMSTLLRTTFEKLAHEANVGVLILHHLSKSGSQSGDKSIDSIRGSGAIAANSRWKALMTVMSADESLTFSDPASPSQTIAETPGLNKKFVMLTDECTNKTASAPLWFKRDSDGVLSPVTLYPSPSCSLGRSTTGSPTPASAEPYKPWGGGYKVRH